MHFEFLVEELSAEAALVNLVPNILEAKHTFAIHPFQGKADLLVNLPARLRAYRSWIPEDWRIVVLIDEDREDCKALKGKLEMAARNAGLITRTSTKGQGLFVVLNRLAIEELEAWFFGDVSALRAAYPKVPATLGKKAKYRDPDSIVGGTWEALERELRKAGYYPTGMPKIEVSRNVSMRMEAARNRSHSFQVFVSGLKACIV
jgi:Domain of unknown function (DUF4276)